MANPIGQIWCGAMMLEHLGYPEGAASVVKAIEKILESGPKIAPLTPDIGGHGTTGELGKALADAVERA
jgi:tartrate dehydrogenase/decarboxylase/D-malate dehydrogenase